jgi:hypothetical protein
MLCLGGEYSLRLFPNDVAQVELLRDPEGNPKWETPFGSGEELFCVRIEFFIWW